MKTIHKILSLFIAIIMFTSCTSELLNIFQNSTNSVKMHTNNFVDANMTNNDSPNTRVSLEPEQGGVRVSWDKADVVSVYSSEKGLTNFFIDETSISEDGFTADFNGSGFSLSPNSTYYAFYPYSASALDKSAIPITYFGQKMLSNGDFKDLGKYDYMWSMGETNSEGHVLFNFEHIGSVIDFNITVPQTAYYNKIRFEIDESSQNKFVKSGLFNLSNSQPLFTGESSDDVMSVSLSDGDGIYVEKDDILHVYLMLPPQDLSKEKIIIRLIDKESNWYSASVTGKNMKAGYSYHYYVNDKSPSGGFTGSGKGFVDDLNYVKISSLDNPSKTTYKDLIVDGNYVYAVGQFGVRKIDYSIESAPTIVAENKIEQNSMNYRSITDMGDYLYISMRQNSAGNKELYNPDVKLTFETNVSTYNDKISNNAIINSFFKKLSLVSCNTKDVTSAYLYKAYYKKSEGVYKNSIVLKLSNGKSFSFLGESYNTREDAYAALKSSYKKTTGDECIVDWSLLPEGNNFISNFELFKCGVFDSYYKTGSAVITETGEPCPNTGRYSAKLQTFDNTGTDTAILTKQLDYTSDKGELSLWLKTSSIVDQPIQIPIIGNNNTVNLSLVLAPESNGYNIGFINDNIQAAQTCHIENNVWYNIKICVNSDRVSMFYRTKECGNYILVSEERNNKNLNFNSLLVGISTQANNALVYIDDYYFDYSSIDDVSYVNGKLLVVDKSNLNVVNSYSLDLKGTEIAIHNNLLFLNMLKGFNVYNINNPSSPILEYSYRYPVENYTECQGLDFFECNGRFYAFICNYLLGYTIVDITNPSDIRLSARNEDPVIYDGVSLKGISYNFDVVVDYPYAYMTHCTSGPNIGTDMDYRGIVTVNLSDFSHLSQTLSVASKADYYNKTTGDHCPISIDKYNSNIIIDNGKKGTLLFNVSNSKDKPQYVGSIMNEEEISVGIIKATDDGRIFVGDDGFPYKLHLYRAE